MHGSPIARLAVLIPAIFITLPSLAATPTTSPECEALDKQNPNHRTFYSDNPTYTDPTDDSATWFVTNPTSEGVNPNALRAAATELSKRAEQYSFIVARNGKPIFEKYFHGATKSSSNNVHSASKSIISSAIGIAIQEHLLPGIDSPVANMLPSSYAALLTGEMTKWTLRDILTMTSGLNWVEDTTEYQIQKTPDWVASILGLGLIAPPATTFNYSSAMTHLLSVILTQMTGMSTCDYVRSRILNPINANPTRWDRDPQGYFSGGFNLYLRARDLTNFGLMVAAGGNWNGTSVIPAGWLNSATAAQVPDGDNDGYSYGFDWWTRSISGHAVSIAWGFGGQFIYLVPDLSLVVVMTTNTADYSSEATGEDILSQYLMPGITSSASL